MDMRLEPTGPQALWEETFQKLGRSAPMQRADESDMDYLRRVSRVGRRYIPRGEEIAQVRLRLTRMPDAVVPRFQRDDARPRSRRICAAPTTSIQEIPITGWFTSPIPTLA